MGLLAWITNLGMGAGTGAVVLPFTETYGIRRTGAEASGVIRVVPGASTTLRKPDEATELIRRT